MRAMATELKVVEITSDALMDKPCCGIKNVRHEGHVCKTQWLKKHLEMGLRSKVLLTPDNRQTGFIEYLPGEYAWRAADAHGYMFIHCLWTFFKEYQGKGYAKQLVDACIEEAGESGMDGVAVVARSKPWLARSEIFLRLGFEVVDRAEPDYELLVKKFRGNGPDPRFKGDWERKLRRYSDGLTILRADQCPHTVRFAQSIAEEARKAYGLEARIEVLEDHVEAQNAPTPYAVFLVIHEGRILADHQISKTRFRNIMDGLFSAR